MHACTHNTYIKSKKKKAWPRLELALMKKNSYALLDLH